MPQNIEIKAKASAPDKQWELARKFTTEPVILEQEDTFYHSPNGRLKLRQFINLDRPAELIFYQRDNSPNPVPSHYQRVEIEDPVSINQLLSDSMGVMGTVRKTRELILYDNIRIHLDQVADLGKFIELEVILDENRDPEEGNNLAIKLMGKLQIRKEDLISKAYIDLKISS